MGKKHLQSQRRRPVILRILLSLRLQEDEKMRISHRPEATRVTSHPDSQPFLSVVDFDFLSLPRRYLLPTFGYDSARPFRQELPFQSSVESTVPLIAEAEVLLLLKYL